jgi:homocysteine S-methyltransferase
VDLRTPFTVLDGGLSTVLEAQGFDLRHPLWTARLLTEDREALVAAHLAYLEAGAEIVISASYQASAAGLQRDGLSPEAAEAALRATTELAQDAVRRHGSGIVAASVGPYGATRADGSEYRGEYDVDAAQLRDFHRERLTPLLQPGPDLLAIETIPTVFETRAIAEAVADAGAPPSWLAFVCRDGATTAGGDRIEDAVRAAADVPGIVAIGVNCTSPVHIGELLERAADVTDLPLIAYANGGQHWNAVDGQWEGAHVPADDPALVERWLAAGARIVGGCCGVGPERIAGLRARRDALLARS